MVGAESCRFEVFQGCWGCDPSSTFPCLGSAPVLIPLKPRAPVHLQFSLPIPRGACSPKKSALTPWPKKTHQEWSCRSFGNSLWCPITVLSQMGSWLGLCTSLWKTGAISLQIHERNQQLGCFLFLCWLNYQWKCPCMQLMCQAGRFEACASQQICRALLATGMSVTTNAPQQQQGLAAASERHHAIN